MGRILLIAIALTAAASSLAVWAAPPRERGPAAAPTSTDLALVQRVIAARRDYQVGLEQLLTYYESVGDAERGRMAEDELRQFHRVAKAAYIIDLDVAGPGLRPDQNVPAANDLFKKAMSYKNKGLGSEYTDNQIRAELLLQQLLQQYPTSNRCSDAAYHLADIFESKKPIQYRRAAVYFERCAQWNPATTLDARLRAAMIYDRFLNERNKAIQWYQAVLSSDPDERRRQDAKKRLSDLEGR